MLSTRTHDGLRITPLAHEVLSAQDHAGRLLAIASEIVRSRGGTQIDSEHVWLAIRQIVREVA
jgi:hypothetical protein